MIIPTCLAGGPRGRRGPRAEGLRAEDRGSERLRAEGRGPRGQGRGGGSEPRSRGRGGGEGPRDRGAEGPRAQVTQGPETGSLFPPQPQRAQPLNSYQWSRTPGTPTTGILSAERGGMAARLEMENMALDNMKCI